MGPIIHTPRANPIHFVPTEQTDDERYHSKNMLADWYYRQIPEGYDKKPYHYPVQLNDKIRLFFDINDHETVTLKLINADGHYLHSWNPTHIFSLAGNTDPYSGSNVQLYTHYLKLSMSDVWSSFTIKEGIYWLGIHMLDTELGESRIVEISEPLMVKVDHPKTLWLEYFNNTNDYDILFEQTNCRLGLRFEGAVHSFRPDSDDTDYKDQGGKIVKLSAQPGETWTLSAYGVTPYLLGKLNVAMDMDNKKVEGTGYVKDSGAKWEVTQTDGDPLPSASIIVREADPLRATFSVAPGTLTLIDTTTIDYPYAILSVFMGEGSANILLESGGRVIVGDSERDLFIDDLEVKKASLDLSGTFEFTAGKYVYHNAAGETYNAVNATVFANYITVSVVKAAAGTVQLKMSSAITVIDWDTEATVVGFATPIEATFSHTFGYSGTHAIRIFGNFASFYMVDGGISSVSDKWPSSMKKLQLGGGGPTTGLTTFNALTLSDCATTLTSLILAQMQLATVPNFNAVGFTKLNFVSFYTDKLSTTEVSTVVNTLKSIAIASAIYNGTAIVDSQVPAAPLNPGAIISKSTLTGLYGWQVQND